MQYLWDKRIISQSRSLFSTTNYHRCAQCHRKPGSMAGIVRFCHGGDGLVKPKAQERPEKGSDGAGNCLKAG